jgi:hypothetical protein
MGLGLNLCFGYVKVAMRLGLVLIVGIAFSNKFFGSYR